MDAAVRATTEILERWAPIVIGVELLTGSKGVFRVTTNGRVVFDKASLKRFPEAGEVARLLEADLGPPIAWRKSRTTQGSL